MTQQEKDGKLLYEILMSVVAKPGTQRPVVWDLLPQKVRLNYQTIAARFVEQRQASAA
jgi:hypothetical protein